MPAFLELATATPQETKAVGKAIAEVLGSGDVISLTGDLGAGKTTLVQGMAKGLGVTQPVLSPTFTLVRQYQGIAPVYHMDVYRLERLQDVIDLGFDEMIDRGGIVLIEWGDAIEALLPPNFLQVELTMPDSWEGRRLGLSWQGKTWQARWERMAELVEPWQAGGTGA
ncbi:MAG TPA: tRNA (adenosine(37)-N6)-threonylcarbamoyltransferase complex ATPase subunit type 1 TsaE [Actinomycetota bacterium]